MHTIYRCPPVQAYHVSVGRTVACPSLSPSSNRCSYCAGGDSWRMQPRASASWSKTGQTGSWPLAISSPRNGRRRGTTTPAWRPCGGHYLPSGVHCPMPSSRPAKGVRSWDDLWGWILSRHERTGETLPRRSWFAVRRAAPCVTGTKRSSSPTCRWSRWNRCLRSRCGPVNSTPKAGNWPGAACVRTWRRGG